MKGAMNGIRYAREHQIPFFGTCGGFQHMIIEFARNVMGDLLKPIVRRKTHGVYYILERFHVNHLAAFLIQQILKHWKNDYRD
ncbi:glutamine amidotransferase-related protein [Paenibacillus gansuensis]|uniref:Glutamine amidotransferase domain-containing protein n=1 Tax=Paenibacillus gansuensis TaxID=306542 RepID=A0ABW5P7I9_9BACL